MPSGSAPIAARSLTLVSTAAKPAPCGSAATNGGKIASPHATTRVPPASTHGAVVTGAAEPVGPAGDVGAEDVPDQPDLGLRAQPGVGEHGVDDRGSDSVAATSVMSAP